MLELIDWDTKVFGYRVGKLVCQNYCIDHIYQLIKRAKSDRLRLLYLYDNPERKSVISEHFNTSYTDIKVVLSKGTAQTFKDESIKLYSSHKLNKDLFNLVLLSGEFSRYKRDRNFKNNEFTKLYKYWMMQNLSNNESFILQVQEENNICGFLSLVFRNDVATIDFISIRENNQGRGYGSKLINYAEDIAYTSGYSSLTIATQNINKVALSFYQKKKFKIREKVAIHHLWL